jgi:hypothetical protein
MATLLQLALTNVLRTVAGSCQAPSWFGSVPGTGLHAD